MEIASLVLSGISVVIGIAGLIFGGTVFWKCKIIKNDIQTLNSQINNGIIIGGECIQSHIPDNEAENKKDFSDAEKTIHV